MLKSLLILWVAVCAPFALCYIVEAIALRWSRQVPAEPRADPLGRSNVVLTWPLKPARVTRSERTVRAARRVC